jgi:hypothetical protein
VKEKFTAAIALMPSSMFYSHLLWFAVDVDEYFE